MAIRAQQIHKEASCLLREALATFIKSFRHGHPDIILRMRNLAQMLHGQRKYVAAQELMERLIVLRKEVFVDETQHTIDVLALHADSV